MGAFDAAAGVNSATEGIVAVIEVLDVTKYSADARLTDPTWTPLTASGPADEKPVPVIVMFTAPDGDTAGGVMLETIGRVGAWKPQSSAPRPTPSAALVIFGVPRPLAMS